MTKGLEEVWQVLQSQRDTLGASQAVAAAQGRALCELQEASTAADSDRKRSLTSSSSLAAQLAETRERVATLDGSL